MSSPDRTHVAYLIDFPYGQPCVMLDLTKALEHAVWKKGTVEPLVRKSTLVDAQERIADLERQLALLKPARA